MGYRMSAEKLTEILTELKQKYRVFAPKMASKRQNSVRYGEISSIEELVWDRPSDFSPKEVYYPVVQTMFYINENEYRESALEDEREMLIFAHPCDLSAIRRLDKLFSENGGRRDEFYARLRDKVKFILMECRESFEECFCVSMGTNKAENWGAAVRAGDGEYLVALKDPALEAYFRSCEEAEFTPEFVTENAKKVSLPEVTRENLREVCALEMWKSFDDKCLSCGGCNTVCPTCSCFDTTDVIYNETSRSGERRRVWASCMQEGFTTMAGGHRVRPTPGERMRFKTLHKTYDFKARFGKENMCVGCGRCVRRCPEKISFSDTINTLSEEIKGLGEGK